MEFGENSSSSVWKNPSDFSGEGKSGSIPYLVFKSDSPEGVTPLLCCCMWKLYTEVLEISRIRYSVCRRTHVCACVHIRCVHRSGTLTRRSLYFRYTTGRGRRGSCSPRSCAVCNSVHIPAPTANLC